MIDDSLTGKPVPNSRGVLVKEDTADYFAIITDVGQERISSALISKVPLKLMQIAVGDGNGAYVLPDKTRKTLVHEVWRGDCVTMRDASNPDMINIRTNIPITVGGFDVREIAVLDDLGNIIVIASAPGWRKLAVHSGTSNPLEINIWIAVTDGSAVEINISHDGVTATLKDLENHDKSPGSHNGHFTDPNLHFNVERLERLTVGTNYELACSKVGKVYELTELPENVNGRVVVIFEPPEAFASGDTWKVNGTPYEVKTANGKALKPTSFVPHAVLTAVCDTNTRTLHFSSLGSGGGGVVASPTPPDDTDVLWFDPKTHLLYVYSGSEWVPIAGVYGE